MADIVNQNFFSPHKFQVVIARFPNIEFFAQDINIPGFSTDSVHIPTGAPNDFYEIGDKLKFNELKITFKLDEDMQTFKEIFNWSLLSQTKSRADFNPFSDISLIALTNNSNTNFQYVVHNAFPYAMSDIDMSTRISEDSPVVMTVFFKYSHYEIK
jgi:hypothetical protein